MPYYRRRYNNYRKRYYTRKRYNNTSYGTAKKALYMAKKAQNQKELKWVQDTISGAVDSTGSVFSVSEVPQGDDVNSRSGNVIYPTSLKVRFSANMNAGVQDTFFRIVFFTWRSDQTPTVTDILETPDVASYKWDGKRMMSNILLDRVIRFNIGGDTNAFFQRKIKFRKYTMGFNEEGIQANYKPIYVLVLSDKPLLTSPTVDIVTRLYFKDA